MNENKELIDNQDFLVWGKEELKSVVEELMPHLLEKKQQFSSFFNTVFPKIMIILFENREEYESYVERHLEKTDRIILTYSRISQNQLLPFLKQSICYQYAKLFYKKISEKYEKKHLWIEEGLAQILSGEKDKLEKNATHFRAFYLDSIVRKDKQIPGFSFFLKTRWEFNKREAYDEYAISYLLVHYLNEIKIDWKKLLTKEEKIKEVEKTILKDCIEYYNQKYPVKNNFYEIKNDSELMDYMNKFILYGWLDYEKNEHIDTLIDFKEKYRTSSVKEILDYGLGTCIEQAKLIQYWFTLMGIENKLFCYRTFDEEKTDDIKMHCFLLFHYQGFWYHFEHSIVRKRGIYKFSTLEEAIEKTTRKFLNEFDLKELIEIPTIPDFLTLKELNEYISSFEKKETEKGYMR